MLFDIFALYGIIILFLTSGIVFTLPIRSKIRYYIGLSSLFGSVLFVFLYLYLIESAEYFAMGVSVSFLINSIFGVFASREVVKTLQSRSYSSPGIEKNIFKKRVILRDLCDDFLKRLVERMKGICSASEIRKIFDDSKSSIFINLPLELEESRNSNGEKSSEHSEKKTNEKLIIKSFSHLVSDLIFLYRAITSPDKVSKSVEKIFEEMKVLSSKESQPVSEFILSFPMGVQDDKKIVPLSHILFKDLASNLAKNCSVQGRRKIKDKIIESSDERFSGIEVDERGDFDVSEFNKTVSSMDFQEGVSHIVSTFSDTMDVLLPVLREEFSDEEVKPLLSNEFTPLLDKYGDFLIRFGFMETVPDDISVASQIKSFSFYVLEKVFQSALQQCEKQTIEAVNKKIKNLNVEDFLIEGINFKGKSGVDFSKVKIDLLNLSNEEGAEKIVNLTTQILDVSMPLIQEDIGIEQISNLTREVFYSAFSETKPSEYRLLKAFSKIIKSTPEGVLDKEKLSFLTKEELEKKARERTEKLEKAYRELKELDEMKDEFIQMSSHELKTPITIIKGNVELLLDKYTDEDQEEQRELLNEIYRSIERQERSVEKFLDASKVKAQQMTLDKEYTNLEEFLSNLVEYKRSLAREKDIQLDLNLENVPEIRFDRDRIETVIRELLDNAFQHTSKGGHIEIGVKDNNENVTFWVKDNGEGIPEDEREKIFKKFYQTDHTREGSGLGLNICKSLVETHDGRIWVDSEQGKGSIFYFSIPKKHD